MLLIDKMKQCKFSNNERVIVDYILSQEEQIKNHSTKMIADKTFTSPSSLIRIAHKLGFDGWNSFKEAYLQELIYMKSHFTNIDANVPFNTQDSFSIIANKISKLQIESIEDTLFLMDQRKLKEAVQLLHKSESIKIFGASNMIYLAQEFQHKLGRINKLASTGILVDEIYFDAAKATQNDCALLLSYSGETKVALEICKILKKRNVPIIAITSINQNSLTHYADVVLNITTREKEYSKIANFSSSTSITLLLDILYSCLFSLDYETNFHYKTQLSKEVESRYEIGNSIIAERLE